jgi:hypothetical protein
MPIHALAKELAGEPRRYRLERDGRDFTVFCFGTAEAAQAFHGRFGGELLPLDETRRRRWCPPALTALGETGMDNEAGDKPPWSKLVVIWIAYGPLTVLLLAFLAIMMAAEWARFGWWRLRRLAGSTGPDEERPPRVWTAPVQYRKPGW